MPKLIEPIPFIASDVENPASEWQNKITALVRPRGFKLELGGMNIGVESKYVTARIPEFDRLELLHSTDWQYGNPQCNVAKIKEHLDWALEEPNRYLLLGGDMMDASTMISVGRGALDQQIGPDDQIMQCAELLAPVAHRILGYVGGNHEYRGHKIGHDFGRALATALGIPYSSGVQHIDIHFGKHDPFKVYLWHGRGGARTKGAKAQMMWSARTNDRANLYINGHIHDSLVLPGIHVDRDPLSKKMRMEKFYMVSSTSFMNYYGSYAESAFYEPNFLLMGAVYLYPDGGFRVSI